MADITQYHLHNQERWFGASGGQIGPGLQTSLLGYRVTTGAVAGTFGTPVQIFNGSETPAQPGMHFFDFRRIQTINAQNANKTYRLRMAYNLNGEASYAAAVANNNFSDLCFTLTNNAAQAFPFEFWCPRLSSGTQIWVAIASADSVAQWVDFLVGLHEYTA
jgi:hypothetical protein